MPARTLFWTGALTFALATAAHAAITISSHKTKDENCTAGVCTPTGPNPNIQVKDLEKLLAQSDVRVVTGQGSTGIGVLAPLTWASSHRLTLDANQSIHIRQPIVVEGTGGATLITNDGGTGGDYYFDAPGSLTFWDTASKLVINGTNFKLERHLKVLSRDIAANPSGNFALATDYDAGADHTYHASPVQTVFQGTFDGLGHAINNLTVAAVTNESTAYAALFVRSQGTLRDISLSNASITVKFPLVGYAGGLVVYNDGTIANAATDGRIGLWGGFAAGGLAYANTGLITHSHSDAAVSGDAGGLVFENSASATIEWSYADGDVASGSGLAYKNEGTITRSYITGSFPQHPAALVAFNSGEISLCYTAGRGDLVGENSGLISQSFTDASLLVGEVFPGGRIVQSYSTGLLKLPPGSKHRSGEVGGLVAENKGSDHVINISESYSTAKVVDNGERYIGGLIGYDKIGPHVEKSYWDMDTSGITDPGQGAGIPHNDKGITGLTDAQLKSALPAGFDPNVWGQDPNINNGWPYLLANPPPQ